MKIAIIGGGAAGCFCAIGLKRRLRDADVTVCEAGPPGPPLPWLRQTWVDYPNNCVSLHVVLNRTVLNEKDFE